MKNVVIFGAGGHAHVISEMIESEGNKVIAMLDDNPNIVNSSGPISDYYKYDAEFVIGIGDNSIREKIAKLDVKWHTTIHPSAIISPSVIIGDGSVIMPNVVINSRTVIGKHCIINTGAIIEHDSNIGDYSHISVGVKTGGTVHVGNKTFIGIGSTIINNVVICDETTIGAGSVVVKDILKKGVYYGVPVKKIRD